MVINPEDAISFSIADAAGRTVMSGKLNIVEQMSSIVQHAGTEMTCRRRPESER
jgi:hypothetical protein